MARSFRHTLISGITPVRSDRWFKRQASRRLRVAVRGALATGDHEVLPDAREIASVWESGKDGKHWFGDLPYRKRQRLTRK